MKKNPLGQGRGPGDVNFSSTNEVAEIREQADEEIRQPFGSARRFLIEFEFEPVVTEPQSNTADTNALIEPKADVRPESFNTPPENIG
jgi:hypothetical protein